MYNQIFNINSKQNFASLALEIFKFQIKNNPIYSAYATMILKGKDPKNINEIPFLPVELFKTEQIICQGQAIEKIFLSSGTKGVQSKHLVSNIELYKISYQKAFQLFYGDITDYCILALLPSYKEREGSSLIYMVDDLIKKSKHPQSNYYLNNYNELNTKLKELESKKQKTILFGVTYALLDLAEEFPQKLEHTIIMETGGMKGYRKELLKEEIHSILNHSFATDNIHSEYGMTELLSQGYSKGNNIFNKNHKFLS